MARAAAASGSPSLPLVSLAAVERFAADAHAAFERAAGRTGVAAGTFELGGRRLTVRLAGSSLAGWAFPALAHRRVPAPPVEGDLTVDVFDSASTGTPMPSPPWPNAAYTPGSEIAGVEGERFVVAFNVGTGTLDILDHERRRALHWIADAARHPAWDVSSPFRLVLHWWLRETGLQLLHAGAVGDGYGAVLLAGKGGAGKSTLALAALAEGMVFLGDDYVLARTEPEPGVLNVYRSAKLDLEHLRRRLPGLVPLVVGVTEPPAGGKGILMLAGESERRIARSSPLRALVIPRVHPGRDTALRRATAGEALAALVPSNAKQLVAVRRADLDRIAALARALPAHELTVGDDLAGAAATLRALARGGR
jgi:hypothetical protein